MFDPPDWVLVGDDGTFGDRFDDPGALEGPSGRRLIIPEHKRFRVIYCATQRAGAFGETLARFRPDLKLMAKVMRLDHSGPFDSSLCKIPSRQIGGVNGA